MDFLYYKLTQLSEGQGDLTEILRIGTFVDRNGKEVKVTKSDLDTYVANFETGEAGQDVPIDIDHNRKEAGGWITALQRQGDKLLARIDWNELGRQLVGDKIYKYMSATIDLGNKIIKSVSLVNFPAVKGLKPVELSEGVQTFEIDNGIIATVERFLNKWYEEKFGTKDLSDKEIDMADEKTVDEAQLREQIENDIRQKVTTELEQQKKAEAQLRERIESDIRSKVEAELTERYERRQGLVKFANEITSGDVALSAKPDQVVELLEKLDDPGVELAKTLLKAKVVDFHEQGSGGKGHRENGKKQLPGHVRQDVISSEFTLKELFEITELNLGNPDEYDLSDFSADQKGF